MGSGAVAVMIKREKEIVESFESAGATGADSARPLGALGLEESRHFERLRRHQVVRTAAPGTWYLDRAAWRARQLHRRRVVVAMLAVALFVLAIGLGLLPTGPR